MILKDKTNLDVIMKDRILVQMAVIRNGSINIDSKEIVRVINENFSFLNIIVEHDPEK